MFYKKNGKIVTAGSGSVIIGNRRIFNPTVDQLISDGWVAYTPPTAPPPPKQYSQLRIIRTLGDQWPEYRRQLEYAGLLDEFFAAEYLAADDPAFVAFMSQVPPEVAEKLKECEI
jgi:hypothetical protein